MTVVPRRHGDQIFADPIWRTRAEADVGRDPAEEYALSHSPSHLLHRAQQLAADLFQHLITEDKITLRQFVLLAAIAEREGANQSELVRTTGIDRSTLADMVQRMEGRGLLSREKANGDGRANSVSLTQAGRELLADVSPRVAAADAAILDALSKGKRQAFMNSLATLSETRIDVELALTEADDDADAPEKRKKKKKKKK